MNIPEPSLTPPEPVTVQYCGVCGEEITPGCRAVRVSRDFWICREECLIKHITENYTVADIAQMIGAKELEVEFA